MAPSAELSITSHSLGMTAHAEVLVTGPAFGAILNGIEELSDPGIKPGTCGLEPPLSNRSANPGPQAFEYKFLSF